MKDNPPAAGSPAGRIVSIDAVRGLVMFTMIFVNDIAGVSHQVVPEWMRHFKGKSGMTFVDEVFPAFLFIVGMSIPFALRGRLERGEQWWKIALHILARTASLMLIGILMVNTEYGIHIQGWPKELWPALMFLCAILAFSSIAPPISKQKLMWRTASRSIRILGFAGLIILALLFRGEHGERIITFSPFGIRTYWYGILGLIAWAYLVGAIVYLTFRGNVTALLACAALLLCLYPAGQSGLFKGSLLSKFVDIDTMLGSLPSITVSGILLASVLIERPVLGRRIGFSLLFIGGYVMAGWLVLDLYGVNKNLATPTWCLWSCAITAAVWLPLHFLSAFGSIHPVAKVMARAGQNVILAYLISEMVPSFLGLTGTDEWYSGLAEHGLRSAILRSGTLAALILTVTAGLNKAGLRLRL